MNIVTVNVGQGALAIVRHQQEAIIVDCRIPPSGDRTVAYVARMRGVFSTIFDRAQNASIQRLHDARRSGHIKSFILPYLGQLDRQLPNPPANLVRREEVHIYPTDFRAMPEEWIERLSLRGEQLTLCLAQAYIPHLINQPSLDPA
jgi:NTE family protein